MRHLYQCPLRWSDMDAFGHVNNVVFLRYLEEARIDFLFRLADQARSAAGGEPRKAATAGRSRRGGPGEQGDTAEQEAFSGGTVVARHEIDYLRPLVHRAAPVTVETWVTKINAASATLDYEITDSAASSVPAADGSAASPARAGGEAAAVYVRARTVIVPYDLAEQRPRRLTAEEKTFLEDYVDDSAAGPGVR